MFDTENPPELETTGWLNTEKPLTLAGEKRLRIISIVLVALGLTNTVRMLATSKRPRAKRAGTLSR